MYLLQPPRAIVPGLRVWLSAIIIVDVAVRDGGIDLRTITKQEPTHVSE